MPKRWDDDERGHVVGDATQLVAGASELVAAFGESDWIAEQPEIHVEAWSERDQRLGLTDAYADETDAYIVEVKRRGSDRSPIPLRFKVGTGELAPESRFAPHGHVVVIDATGVL